LQPAIKKMEVIGKVTKIEENEMTVKDDMGTETTVEVKNVKGTKVKPKTPGHEVRLEFDGGK
jgi:preprotein translocase subunit YajC